VFTYRYVAHFFLFFSQAPYYLEGNEVPFSVVREDGERRRNALFSPFPWHRRRRYVSSTSLLPFHPDTPVRASCQSPFFFPFACHRGASTRKNRLRPFFCLLFTFSARAYRPPSFFLSLPSQEPVAIVAGVAQLTALLLFFFA